METLIQRNLRLYFNNLSGVFFSLMGALISFGLYLLFLQQNMLSSWAQVPNTKLLLDLWLIGGTLTVTAVTTTANGLGQMIRDRETGALADPTMTDISFIGIQLSYLISAMIIGIVMQLIMLVAMVGYFGLLDQVRFSLDLVVPLFGIVLLSSLVWTAFNLLMLSFITNTDSLGKVGHPVQVSATNIMSNFGLSLLIGILSMIFDSERLNFSVALFVHYIGVLLLVAVIAMYNGGQLSIQHYPVQFFGGVTIIYGLVWIGLQVMAVIDAKRINQRIKDRKRNTL